MSRASTTTPKRSSAAEQKQAITDSGGILSHRQILFIIFGLMAGMFLSALDQTIVGTSMRTVADDLDGLSLQAWVTTAYLIVSTISTPIYGKLSDIFGRRPLFIIAISIFLIGSLAAGFASSMYELAIFRAIQGLGAGGLMALPLTIMGDILAPRERAKYQGYFLAVFGISSVIGPVLGGLLSGTDVILGITGWRWIFLINIPVGLIAMAIVLRFLHIPHTKRAVRIDWWGAATVIMAAVPLLLIAEQGREWGWDSPGAFICYVVGAIGIALFITVEKLMGDDALIPLKLFKSPTFSMATILGVLVGFGMFGAMMTIPLYLQLVTGATPTEAGLLMIPMIMGLMISSIVSGQLISRTGRYKIFPILGTAFLSGGFYYLTFVSADKPVWFVMVGMLMVGLGLGQLMQTLTIASQNSVGARDIGVATSASTFFRQIGGTLGTAVVFSVLFSRLPDTLAAAFTNTSNVAGLTAAMQDPAVTSNPVNSGVLKVLDQLQTDPAAVGNALSGDTSFLKGVDGRLSLPFLEGFANASVTVFYVSLVVVLVAFVLSFFMKATPLRAKSALQEASDDDAKAAAASAAATADAAVTVGVSATATEPARAGSTAAGSVARHSSDSAASIGDAQPGTN
jgi:EmrB/QacA subfamily drug resistance transporter